MAEGCLGKITQFVLFITNFIIFILGCASFGVAIWVLVDKPSFFDIIDKAEGVCNGTVIDDSCDDITTGLEIFGAATYIILTVAVLVVIVSFFGCCGAWKESKCMLGTYFTIVLALFIVMLVGAILGYSGNLDEQIKKPFTKALNLYRDQTNDNVAKEAYKDAWNEAQKELLCCGVDSVADWDDDKFGFVTPINKPIGCCYKNRQGDELDDSQQKVCREAPLDKDSTDYYFEGCYSKMKDLVEENQEIVVGVAIGVVVFMFLNMVFAFSLCMMVES